MISFIVCGNGFGHLRRVVSVIEKLIERKFELKINVFCTKEHSNFLIREINFNKNSKYIEVFTHLHKNEISWIKGFNFNDYKIWQNEISQDKILRESILIISDNHVLPAIVFKNCILMGSFLWHLVTNIKTNELLEIFNQENNFLKGNKVDLICLNDMVMPNLLSLINPIRMPWFCERKHFKKWELRDNNYLVTGGGTELTNKTLLSISKELKEKNHETLLFLDNKLYSRLNPNDRINFRLFNFTEESFLNLKGIICRPGIGILTDAISYNIPIIVINDNYNKEITYNAGRVDELGIGKRFDIESVETNYFSMEIDSLLNNGLLKYYDNIKNLKVNGHIKTAKFIINRIEGHE